MKFLFWNIKRVVKTEPEDKPNTLVVTGICNPKDLEDFEAHCEKKGVKIVATKLPVLGVFNLADSTAQNGVVQKK